MWYHGGLCSQGQKFKELLLTKGCSGSAINQLNPQVLLASSNVSVTHVTMHCGWYGDRQITRYGAFGIPRRSDKFKENRFHPHFRKSIRSGQLKTYVDGISPALKASSYLTFCYLLALAAPLGARIGRKKGLSVCLSGQSSTGKTLATKLALSTVTRADNNDLETFGATDGYMTTSLAHFAGLVRAFNDVKATKRNASETAKLLQRTIFECEELAPHPTQRDTNPLKPNFSILLFTLEKPLFEFYRSGNVDFEGGEAVRCPDIPIPSGTKGGIFDMPVEGKSSRLLAEELEQVLDQCHGTLMPEWTRHLAKVDVEDCKAKVTWAEQKFIEGLDLNGQQSRMISIFALLVATATIAAKNGLLPVSLKFARDAVLKLCVASLGRMGESQDVDSKLKEQTAGRVIDFLDKLKSLPQVKIGTRADKTTCSFGFRRKEGNISYCYAKSSDVEKAIGNSVFLRSTLLPKLEAAGYLTKTASGYTVPVKQDGLGRSRWMKLKRFGLKKEVERIVAEWLKAA